MTTYSKVSLIGMIMVTCNEAIFSYAFRTKTVLRASSIPPIDDFDVQARIAKAFATVEKISGSKFTASSREPLKSSLVHRGSSRLFLDTANVEEWEQYLGLGIFYGVTTNPILLQRAGVPCTLPSVRGLARSAIDDYGLEEFMIQAWGGDRDSLIRTGRAMASFDHLNRIVVKLPLTIEGIFAARALGQDGVRICMTACYNQQQAFLSASLGAEYVAPYLGRMSSHGKDGVFECAEMQRVIDGLGSSTRVLVASLRSASQLTTLAAQGCGTFTFSPAIAAELLDEPLTTASAADFEAAALAMG